MHSVEGENAPKVILWILAGIDVPIAKLSKNQIKRAVCSHLANLRIAKGRGWTALHPFRLRQTALRERCQRRPIRVLTLPMIHAGLSEFWPPIRGAAKASFSPYGQGKILSDGGKSAVSRIFGIAISRCPRTGKCPKSTL